MAHFRKQSHRSTIGGAAVIDLGAERDQRRRPQTAATDVAVIIHLEETALILAAAVTALMTGAPDGEPGFKDPLRHAYAALRGVLENLGQRQGCPHASFPELLDDRLCCVEASDGNPGAFTRVVDYYCEGDPSVALCLLDRLRRLDPELGIPSGKVPGNWTRKQRATAVSWLRFMEHAHEVAVVTEWIDLEAV